MTLPDWTPFKKVTSFTLPSDAEIAKIAERSKQPFADVSALLKELSYDLVVVNSRYHVNIHKTYPPGFPAVISLTIIRHDRQPAGPERYHDFLRIKNELVGPEHEGFEIYPAMERNVDTTNQYYLWILADPDTRFPLGYGSNGNAVNAPFEEGDLPKPEGEPDA